MMTGSWGPEERAPKKEISMEMMDKQMLKPRQENLAKTHKRQNKKATDGLKHFYSFQLKWEIDFNI